mgnify:FL=1
MGEWLEMGSNHMNRRENESKQKKRLENSQSPWGLGERLALVVSSSLVGVRVSGPVCRCGGTLMLHVLAMSLLHGRTNWRQVSMSERKASRFFHSSFWSILGYQMVSTRDICPVRSFVFTVFRPVVHLRVVGPSSEIGHPNRIIGLRSRQMPSLL